MNFWEIIFLFFAFQAFIIAVLFFLKPKGDRVANSILGIYLLLFSLNITYNVLYWSKLMFTPENVHIFGLLPIIWISYPPLIYFYVRRVVTNTKFSLKDLAHAIPVLLITSFYAPFIILGASKKTEVLQNNQLGEYIINGRYNLALIVLIMIFYTILTYNTYKNNSLGHNINRWLKWLIGSFACYVAAMAIYYILSRLGWITVSHDYFITYTIIFFIGLVTYFGFHQPDVFDGKSMDEILPLKKYKKTGLTEGLSLELKSSLITFMTSEKPFLNSNLRLDDLATKLNLSRHHMSQIINEHFDTNFFDYINAYRIEESKNLLGDTKDTNISDVIYLSGFNNRVSFYKAFKKHTGVTPTEYKTMKASRSI